MRPRTTSLPLRRTTAAAATLVSALTLTACASGGSGDPNTVVYWDTSSAQESKVFTELATQCGKQGGYTVEVESVSFDQALNDYKTAAQGGSGPDVLRADVGWVAQLAKAGLIQDLSGTPLADTSAFLDVPAASTKLDGKPYGVPQVTDTLALFYNESKLDKAGVEPPETWDEVIEIAPKLGGKQALFLNNDAFYALPFVYSQGGNLVDEKNSTIEINSAKTVAGMQTPKKLLDKGAARTALDQTNSYTNMKTAFTSGEVAMMIDGPWVTPELSESEEFSDGTNLGIAPLPGPKGTSPVGGHDYVLRQGSDATEASTKFVQCMSSAESQSTLATELGLMPTRKDVYDNPAVQKHPIVSKFAPLVENAHSRPWIPEGDALMEPLKRAYANILAGKQDTETALEGAAKAYKDNVVPEYRKN